MKQKGVLAFFLLLISLSAAAQQTLTLSDCRAMALKGNKQLAVAQVKGNITSNLQNSAKALSLPRVNAVLGYEHFGKEISLLNSDQKAALGNLGSNLMGGVQENLGSLAGSLVQQGILSPEQLGKLMQNFGGALGGVQDGLNGVGQSLKDAFRTDTRNIYAGALVVTQPIYMGGAITAANNMADISAQMVETSKEKVRQDVIFSVDNAYWLAVQLCHKKKLADEYVAVVRKLNDDVQKMINEGVATRADGLKVSVALNEAEMAQLQVEDGVKLAKMLLCQLCGLQYSSTEGADIILADEEKLIHTGMYAINLSHSEENAAIMQRPELQLLSQTSDLSMQSAKLIQAASRPQVLATAGYMVSNPSVYNGFEKKFNGTWNIGLMVRIPIFDGKSTSYKVNSAKAMGTIAELELSEATELIHLQVAQSKFKVKEAEKRISIAQQHITSAKENLRCANLGFSEGVMTMTDVMQAQTAWLQAETQLIDAEIGLELAILDLQKALGMI